MDDVVVEKERKEIHELVDKVFNEDEDMIKRAVAVTEINVRLQAYQAGYVVQISDIHGDPKRGVVTPLE